MTRALPQKLAAGEVDAKAQAAAVDAVRTMLEFDVADGLVSDAEYDVCDRWLRRRARQAEAGAQKGGK